MLFRSEFDRTKAKLEGRVNLGGDIMIHGKAASIGCLAMGDAAAEELFVLAAEAGVGAIDVILSPLDFRVHPDSKTDRDAPAWAGELHQQIGKALRTLPASDSQRGGRERLESR